MKRSYESCFLALAVLLHLLTFIGCGPDRSGSDVLQVSRTALGDTILVSHLVGAHPDTASLEGVWTLPMDSVEALTVVRDGSVLIAAKGKGILRVDPAGEKVTTLAPGPFGRIVGIATRSNGVSLVRDEGYGTLIEFSDTWEPVRTIPLPPGRKVYRSDALTIDDHGTVWLAVGARFPEGDTPVQYPRVVFLSLDEGLQPKDSLAIPSRFAEACPTLSRESFSSGRFEDIRVRYYPKPKWALDGIGNLFIGCPASYSFELHREGAPIRRTVKPWTPEETTREERLSFQTIWTTQMNLTDRYETWGWSGPELPPQKPAYHRLIPSSDGSVWVWPVGPSVRKGAPPMWPMAGLPDTLWVEPRSGFFDVFGQDGALKGHVQVTAELGYSPLTTTVDPVIRGDTVWMVIPGPTGKSTLGRYSVRWSR